MSTSNYLPVRDDWLALRQEAVLEPELPIVDAHHHFYDRPGWTYLDSEYLADARSGHNVVASVYMQALTRYKQEGPAALKPVGETECVNAMAQKQAEGIPQIAKGIVGHADLRLGAEVREVLEAHVQAGAGRFKGVRHLTTWDADSSLVNPLSAVPRGLLLTRPTAAGLPSWLRCSSPTTHGCSSISCQNSSNWPSRRRTPPLSSITAAASSESVPTNHVASQSSRPGCIPCGSSPSYPTST